MKTNRFWLVLALFFNTINFWYAKALADVQSQVNTISLEANPPLDNILSSGTIYYSGIIRAFLSLIVVIGLIYLTAWIYKKLNNFNTQKLIKSDKELNLNKFKLLSTQSLGSNKNLHVVEINGKYLVIGSTANNINLIKEFDKSIIDNAGSSAPLEKMLESQSNEDIPADEQLNDILEKYKD